MAHTPDAGSEATPVARPEPGRTVDPASDLGSRPTIAPEAGGEGVPDAGPEGLRRLFRRHAAGVAVVTAVHRDRPVGLLVTSLASVSAEPPLISFNVSTSSSSWPALAEAGHLGIHILHAEQEDLAQRFARRGADRFAHPTRWESGAHGVPVLDGVAAWSVVAVERRIPVADHIIVIGRLLQAEARDGAAPLLHHDGTYHHVTRERPPARDGLPGGKGAGGLNGHSRPDLSVVRASRGA